MIARIIGAISTMEAIGGSIIDTMIRVIAMENHVNEWDLTPRTTRRTSALIASLPMSRSRGRRTTVIITPRMPKATSTEVLSTAGASVSSGSLSDEGGPITSNSTKSTQANTKKYIATEVFVSNRE